MKKVTAIAAVLLGVASLLIHSTGNSQPMPYSGALSAIESQQQYSQPTQQRLSPRNRLFLSPMNQAQHYDALTINGYLMGRPGNSYHIHPVVQQPMYTQPGWGNQ